MRREMAEVRGQFVSMGAEFRLLESSNRTTQETLLTLQQVSSQLMKTLRGV